MTVRMIVAVDQGNSIGNLDGSLPWKIPADLERFKNLTTNSTVLMGRKTFESLNRPNGLPNRRNVVLSRSLSKVMTGTCNGIDVVQSLDWVKAHQTCLGCTPPDLWVIGGVAVYTEALQLKLVNELYITLVKCTSEAPVKLPFELFNTAAFIAAQQAALGVIWKTVAHEECTTTGQPPYSYVTLKKINSY